MKGEVPQKPEEASRAARISCCHRFNCTFLQRSHSFSLCLQVPTIFFNVFFHQIKWANQYNIQMRKWNSKFLRSKMFFCFVSLFCQKIAVDTFVFSSFCRKLRKKIIAKISILKQGLVSSGSGKTQSRLTNE